MNNNRDSSEPKISSEKAVQLCDRNFGVDGVIFLLPAINATTHYTMRIFNSEVIHSFIHLVRLI